jgi:transitional endoplasmic reticulum ATPase
MGKTLDQQVKTVNNVDIVKHGEKLILPQTLSMEDAIELLERRIAYDAQEVAFSQNFEVFPWDGANALDKVLTNRYGWAPATATPSMFGPQPPKMITIDVGYGERKEVAWGRFSLPNIAGFIQCSADKVRGRLVFKVDAKVLRRDEQNIKELFAELNIELLNNSIYRGKAFKMRFRDDEGDILEMPEPQFINHMDIDPATLVYASDVQNSIETNLFTPIRRIRDCKANGIPVKRGILLGGMYGCGKTLAAKVAARLAVENDVTYLYVQRADELADAVEFVKMYSDPGAVIFCEDIDRAVNGNRSTEMDDILNVIDGIDTKSANIITVLTTNNLAAINPAMLRPGRLDAVINVTEPDAPAAEKLVRIYGGKAIDADLDLTEVGQSLSGQIPAVIAEVVKRAKLSQLKIQEPGTLVEKIGVQALLDSAASMTEQVKLLRLETNVYRPTAEDLIRDRIMDDITPSLKLLGRVAERLEVE